MERDGLDAAVDCVLKKVNGLRDYCDGYRLRLALETVLRVGIVDAKIAGKVPFSQEESECLRLAGVVLLSDLYNCERAGKSGQARVWAYADMDDVSLECYVREERNSRIDRLRDDLEVEPYAK